ncbi:hypothetical protein, partial [Klebsiella pneumoniae]|uniref:hypothetical protein n=1 Tax=Klebsiella pneumoniae TaxID=573 RepID=UPI0024DE3648
SMIPLNAFYAFYARSGGARSRLFSSDFNVSVVPIDGVERAEQEQRLCLHMSLSPPFMHSFLIFMPSYVTNYVHQATIYT